MILFDKAKQNECVPILLADGENEYVRLAVNDLCADFLRVTGTEPRVIHEIPDGEIHIEISTERPCFNDVYDADAETFTLKCDGTAVKIRGIGYLGTLWGIYTFSEKVLGVSPTYLFDDFPVKTRERIEVGTFDLSDRPSKPGFRGIFINDEDLFTEWKGDSGKRYIGDYEFYQTVMNPKISAMVAETALRLQLNFVIPGSFINIDNPPEKALVDEIAKRGLFVSQHHIEPCGVSSYTFRHFCGQNGLDGAFSYISNRDTMMKVWRHYIEKWAAYPNVIWQIGLRGEADRPIWYNDPSVAKDLISRGALVSEAYNAEYGLINEATHGKAKYFTSTLWMEGAELMAAKTLTFPKGTVAVLSDIGVNQMYAADYDTADRSGGTRYGIYYHLQFWGHGPHLAPGVGLDKLYYNLKKAHDNGDTAYTVLNVSNVRPFVFELGAYAKMLWDTESYDKTAYETAFCDRRSGNAEELRGIIHDYYAAFASLENKYLADNHANFFSYNYDEPPHHFNNFQINDGCAMRVAYNTLHRILNDTYEPLSDYLKVFRSALKTAIPRFDKVIERIEALESNVDADEARYLHTVWGTHARCVRALYDLACSTLDANEHLTCGNKKAAAEALILTSSVLRDYLEYRKSAEYGSFENWYKGDKKLNAPALLSLTESAIRLLQKT